MPTIYAADVQLGKPKKIAPAVDKENRSPESAPKPKRTLSEEAKQKLREARERKKQERIELQKKEEEEQNARQEAERQAEADKQAKKEAAAAKRRETRLKRKAESQDAKTETDSAAESGADQSDAASTAEKAPKAKRRGKVPLPDNLTAKDIQETKKNPQDQPPAWFTKFVTTIMTEKKEQEGLKASKKELRAEGEKAAEAKWADTYTRDRIRTAVDGHLGQMYSMIFR